MKVTINLNVTEAEELLTNLLAEESVKQSGTTVSYIVNINYRSDTESLNDDSDNTVDADTHEDSSDNDSYDYAEEDNFNSRTFIKKGNTKWFVIDRNDDVLLAVTDTEQEAFTYFDKYESSEINDEQYDAYVLRAM